MRVFVARGFYMSQSVEAGLRAGFVTSQLIWSQSWSSINVHSVMMKPEDSDGGTSGRKTVDIFTESGEGRRDDFKILTR